MRVIRDTISNGLLILAVTIMLYFIFVLEMLSLMIYPMLLLVGALLLRVYVNKRVKKDPSVDEREGKSIFMFYLIALIGIGLGNLFIEGLYDYPIENYLSSASTDAVLFTVLMAIVEEAFFRGELLEWLTTVMPPSFAVISDAAIFMGYHLNVYGRDPECLLYVFIGGLSLAFVTIQSRRLSPAMLAHITNNLVSVLGI